MVSTSLQPFSGAPLFSSPRTTLHFSSSTFFKWEWRRDQGASPVVSRIKGQAFRVLANPNVSSGEKSSNNNIIMVDPLEAKRLAAKQLQEIRAKEKLKRRRQIEAINGAWAMIGLTAGLVIEGHTGKNILAQVKVFSLFFWLVIGLPLSIFWFVRRGPDADGNWLVIGLPLSICWFVRHGSDADGK